VIPSRDMGFRLLLVFDANTLLCIAMFLSGLTAAGETLKNADIAAMIQAMVPQDVIIQKITDCERQQFKLFPEDLIAMAPAGVPDEVIRAMAAKQAGRAVVGITPARLTPASTTAGARQGRPVRVFVADSDSWASGRGARPQTMELIKTIRQRCPEFARTCRRETPYSCRSSFRIIRARLSGMPTENRLPASCICNVLSAI
jgi:hypothetical protein